MHRGRWGPCTFPHLPQSFCFRCSCARLTAGGGGPLPCHKGLYCCPEKGIVLKPAASGASGEATWRSAGANDVGMIQAAHIGVGITGREGRAAVLASDFAFAQFRFLARLLLLHGRWSYLRNAEIVQYAVYKNLVYCLCALYFGFVSGVPPPPPPPPRGGSPSHPGPHMRT